MLGRTMHGIDYDHIHDEVFVPQQFGQAILVFRGAANGQEAPIRVIQGSRTQMRAMDRLTVDPYNDEIYVPEGQNVLVFDRAANGNVAPKRVLGGPDTGFTAAASVGVDHLRDLIVIGGHLRGESRQGTAQLVVFDRTAGGNAKPKRVIAGPASRLTSLGNIRVYPERGLIFVIQQVSGYVGVWSIDDDGDVPPRFTVGGPDGMLQKPRGLDLDPKHNAVIVSDKGFNAVLTYEAPEIFEPRTQ